MANLKAYFKKGYNKTNISHSDEEIILERFIDCQNPRLKELLMREKSMLTIEKIADRAHELERSLPKSGKLFMAEAKTESNDKLDELCALMKEQMKRKQEKRDSEKRNFRPRQALDKSKMEGHCISYVRRQKCPRGQPCKYLHSDSPPKRVVDYVKTL